jgi:hypothetical protein
MLDFMKPAGTGRRGLRGRDAKTDEVIELGMVKFAYCPDG